MFIIIILYATITKINMIMEAICNQDMSDLNNILKIKMYIGFIFFCNLFLYKIKCKFFVSV